MQFAHFSANLQQNYNGLWYLTLRMIKTRVKPGFFIGKPEKTRNPGFLTDRAKQQPYSHSLQRRPAIHFSRLWFSGM